MKMRSRQTLFDEFAAALQFPEYFGENWHAFADCLSDLAWWPATQRRLIVWDSSHVLNVQPDEYSLFLEILRKSAEEWASDDEFREACPLNVVLHTEEGDLSDLRSRLDAVGIAYSLDEISGFTF